LLKIHPNFVENLSQLTSNLAVKIAIAIPARLGSIRLPRKVLADLCGKPMIQRVYEIALAAAVCDGVFVLVDSVEVEDAVQAFGGRTIMTSPDCRCGTERIASVLDQISGDFIVNLQGDEPLLDCRVLRTICAEAAANDADIVTPIFKITTAVDLDDPARVKVALCGDGRALYFSRSPIPFVRGVEKSQWLAKFQFWGHIGVYGYRRSVLQNYNNFSNSALEAAESLEQLRFLENGYSIYTVVADSPTIGVDRAEDLAEVAKIMANESCRSI
jgi:3-deoxy-manno-octulosonate cytidylyltransferase (CMP-KDO synthetase)